MSSIINGFIVFSLCITLTYLVGLLTFITDHEENKCDMTFMFEYPQFVRISNRIDSKYPKYGLYAYSEGRLTERTRDMYFDGIPVLFIPGNAGSHRQVRSLASIALRKAFNSRVPFHFDYFALDLNAELSGLNGAVLLDQLNYANHSMHRILELYRTRRNVPKSVVLFGHSMGGIIARRLVANQPAGSDSVPIVLTLASPHKRAPLVLDYFTYDFYDKIKLNNSTSLDTTFVSLTGGYSDFLVPSFLTSLSDEYDDSLNVVTTHIPRSWLTADHLCILWCKQTILAINRALFDSVDPKTKQISGDSVHRRAVFHHHLIHHSGTNIHIKIPETSPHIRNNGQWIEHLSRQYSVELPHGTKETHFYMIRLLHQAQHESVTVVAINLKTVEWAFACGAHIPRGAARVCEVFTHLTELSEISPSALNKRRTLSVNMHELMKNNSDLTHVVLRVLPTDEPVFFNIDVYNSGARTENLTLPAWWSLKQHSIIEQTAEKAIHYELLLPQLQHVTQSYLIYIDHLKCTTNTRHATATVKVPWGHQNYHKHFVETNDNKPLHVRLYDSKPQTINELATVEITLDPNCTYRISIRSSLLGMLSQMARFYSPLLIVNVVAVLLMTLKLQLKSLEENQYCSMFFVAVKEGAKPYYILTIVKLISRFMSSRAVVKFVPAPDWVMMAQEGTDFFLLPLLLYICSVGIVWLMGVGLCVSLVVFETTVHKVALKFLARTVSFTVSWSDNAMSALHKVPFIVAGTLIGLSVLTTGSLALCVGLVFYFMKLTQLSQDYIEELVWYYVKKVGNKLKRRNQEENVKEEKRGENNATLVVHNATFFHATLFLIWFVVTLINIPSVLTWAHNYKYSSMLRPDPSFFPGFLMSICAVPLWQLDMPKIQRKWYSAVGQVVFAFAVVSLVYAPISIFRLNYILPMVYVIVTLHQLSGLNRSVLEEQPEEHISYETVKAKLE